MSIIDTLIFDRSPADTEALETLLTKAKAGTLTAAEKAVLASPSHKGAYNYTDLNRVNSAIVYLVQMLEMRGYVVSGYHADSTVWNQQSIPTKAQLKRYLDNVSALRAVLKLPTGTPSVPKDMEALTPSEANAIEKILSACEKVIKSTDAVYLHSEQPLLFCGFAIYPFSRETKLVQMAICTADGLAVYTADGMAVMIEQEE